jgi:hypothetical protein
MPVDTNDLTGRFSGQVSVKPEEHPEDRAARIKIEHRRNMIADFQDVAIFATLLLGIILVGGAAAYEGVMDGAASADTKSWGQTVLSAILTGGISFAVGRMSRSR